MKEIMSDLDRWRAQGRRVVLARVVDIEGSGPRLPGAAMAEVRHGAITFLPPGSGRREEIA